MIISTLTFLARGGLPVILLEGLKAAMLVRGTFSNWHMDDLGNVY